MPQSAFSLVEWVDKTRAMNFIDQALVPELFFSEFGRARIVQGRPFVVKARSNFLIIR
jgi:hypothetical protein